ncbi:MAG: cyclase [Chloroflexota bacterium]|nr:MAG: cyclase [Chloroflexota bacterium]
MKFKRSFRVSAPLDEVRQFHQDSKSLAAITPPPVVVRVRRAPESLQDGAEMDFTLWLGPLPIRWVACIEDVSQAGFTDRQRRGPFSAWVHRHSFLALDDHTTEVVDEITARLSLNPLKWIAGASMWVTLPVLFAYRAWKTRRMLERTG